MAHVTQWAVVAAVAAVADTVGSHSAHASLLPLLRALLAIACDSLLPPGGTHTLDGTHRWCARTSSTCRVRFALHRGASAFAYLPEPRASGASALPAPPSSSSSRYARSRMSPLLGGEGGLTGPYEERLCQSLRRRGQLERPGEEAGRETPAQRESARREEGSCSMCSALRGKNPPGEENSC